MLLMVTAHHLPLPRREGQVQSPDSDLLPCQRGGSALSAQHTSSGQLQIHLPRVTSPGYTRNMKGWLTVAVADPISVFQIFALSEVSYVLLDSSVLSSCKEKQ